MSRPQITRSGAEWTRLAEDNLGQWWDRWEAPLRRHDDLAATVAAGDNVAFFSKQVGLGRAKWIAETLVAADMWDRKIVVFCRPMMRLYWRQTLETAGYNSARIEVLSGYRVMTENLDKRVALRGRVRAADVCVIEPVSRPLTKSFAGMARLLKEAGSTTQFITTTTLAWGAQLSPPRYVDSCLKLLGYLDAPEDIKVAWAEDCWAATA